MIPPALRHRPFALMWASTVTSNVGTWMQNVARAWVIYRATGDDPLWLGWLGATVAVPLILIPPFAGVVVDRVDRVRLLTITQSIGAVTALLLALLGFAGELRPWHLLVASAVASIALAFDNPARHSLVAELVPGEALGSAVALNAATFTGAAMIGPAIAGVILHGLGAPFCFLLNGLSFGAVLAVLPAVGRARASRPRPAHEGGFAEALARPRVRALLGIAAIAALFARAHTQMLPVFARSVFGAGARTYGALLAAGGAGALGAAIVWSLRRDVDTRAHERRLFGAVTMLVLSLVGFAATRSVAPALLCLAIAGAAATTLTTTIATDLQHATPAHQRGRVLSLQTVTLIGLPSIGALILAVIAEHVSPRAAMLFSAASLAIGYAAIATRPARAAAQLSGE